MGIDLDAMAAAAVASKASMVYLCNPNNPTAMLVDPQALRALSSSLPAETALLVDEAYNELTDRPHENSMVDLIRAGRNVIVSRTFSKIYGLAGLRIGYILSTPENAERINSQHHDHRSRHGLPRCRHRLAQRRGVHDILEKPDPRRPGDDPRCLRKAGLEALPSQANFVFVRVPDANAVKARMSDHGIIIRGAYGKRKQWSRVSTGRIEDMRRYAAALPEVARA